MDRMIVDKQLLIEWMINQGWISDLRAQELVELDVKEVRTYFFQQGRNIYGDTELIHWDAPEAFVDEQDSMSLEELNSTRRKIESEIEHRGPRNPYAGEEDAPHV
jgi:hypothetical protein